jgi:hypothetical protein
MGFEDQFKPPLLRHTPHASHCVAARDMPLGNSTTSDGTTSTFEVSLFIPSSSQSMILPVPIAVIRGAVAYPTSFPSLQDRRNHYNNWETINFIRLFLPLL